MRRHWSRLFVELGILASMIVVNAIDGQLYLNLISLSLVILPVAGWTVFGLLLWTARQAPDIQSLHERVDDALTLALITTVAALIALEVLGRQIGIITAPIGNWVTVALGYIVVMISVPALSFLQTWRSVYLPMVRRRRDESTMGFTHEPPEEDELPGDPHAAGVGDLAPGRVVHVDHVISTTGAEVDQGHRDPVDKDRLPPPVAESGA